MLPPKRSGRPEQLQGLVDQMRPQIEPHPAARFGLLAPAPGGRWASSRRLDMGRTAIEGQVAVQRAG